MKKKFGKGLLLGLAVGVFASKYLQTAQGKKTKKKLEKKAQELLNLAQERMKDLKKPTKAAYNRVVKKLVDEYAQHKHIAGDVKEFLTEYLKKHWEDFGGKK